MVLAFTGLRWEEAVAVPIENVDLDGQWITVDRTASESGGRRDVRADLKTRAAERVAAIPDIAMPAVRRLLERHAEGRERSEGGLYSRLINGERGGYLGYAMWRRYLALAHGYTASHKDGPVKYTAHELRHVCASLLIASGATDMQVTNQMGHSKIETTKNIYGHLFAQDRAQILRAMNAAVSRLYVHEDARGGPKLPNGAETDRDPRGSGPRGSSSVAASRCPNPRWGTFIGRTSWPLALTL